MYLPQVPLTRYVLPAFAEVPEREGSGAAASLPPSSDYTSVTRTFCGALFFPTIATFLGIVYFYSEYFIFVANVKIGHVRIFLITLIIDTL